MCPHCRHTDPAFAFEPVERRAATVRSWTVVRQSFLPGFDDDLPFVLVDVALDGARRPPPDRPAASTARTRRCGSATAVTVAFERLADGVAVPAFALAPTS